MILVVDDESGVNKLISSQLRQIGYDTIPAESVAEAESAIREQQVDLIVLDWLLPDGIGIDIIRSLSEKHASEKLPVVVLTGVELDSETITLLGNFAVPIVSKPWRKDDLFDAIETGFLAERAV